MFTKRFCHFSRAKAELFFEIVIPAILLFLGILFSNQTWVLPPPNIDLTDSGYYPTPQNIMINKGSESYFSNFPSEHYNFQKSDKQDLYSFEDVLFEERNVNPVRMGSYFVN